MDPNASPEEQANEAIRPNYKVLSDAQKATVSEIKDRGVSLYAEFCCLPLSREMSLAKTKLEEAIMWAVKAVTK